MRDPRWSIALGLSLLAAACGGDDSGDNAGAGGGGGVGGNGACVGGGKGTFDVRIKIDSGVPGDVTFKAASGFQQDVVNNTKIEIAAGQYSVEARRVTMMGLIVGRAYSAKPVAPVCLVPGSTQPVTIEYKLEPGSQKLWFAGGVEGVHTAAFDAADLSTSAEIAASVKLSDALTDPRALAFDRMGNLWVADQSGSLQMYGRDSLGVSRASAPEVVLSGTSLCQALVPCGPRALAFDNEGGVWVALSDQVAHFPASQLLATGEPQADVTLSGPDVSAPSALALDAAGSLWITNADAGVAKFNAARLLTSSAEPADVVLTGSTPEPVVSELSTPTTLAFDADGALWVGYFGSNVVARYEPDLLEMGGAVTPSVQLQVDVLALIESMAFDDSGSLWIGGSAGKIARISVTQLMAGGDPSVDAVTLTSADVSHAVGLAFDPPAKLTPIAR
ncbi:MAG: hypothetical protein ACOY0T_36515 [Myxococcota bacterium]